MCGLAGQPPQLNKVPGPARPIWDTAWTNMTLDMVFFWLLILAFCELSLAASTSSMIGSGGVLILASCA